MIFDRNKLLGHLIATITIIIWGTTFISSKILLTSFTTLQIMIMRFMVAYVTLFIINHKKQKTTLHEELIFLLLAVTGSTIYYLLEIKALTFTYASNVSIILSVAPIFTALLAHYFTKDEKLSGMLFLGSGIAMLGVVLVVFNGTVVLKVNPFGDILSILAAFSWSIYSIILKKLVHKYDPVYITRKVVFYSILTSLPILLMEHKPFPIFEIKTPSVLFNLIFLGVFGSGICYVAWNIAARKLGIVTTNNYIYVSPFITMMAAGIFLHEKVSVMGVIGALFIIAGVITAGLKKTENQENKDDSELNFGEN